MKTTILKISTIFLLIILMGAGCENEPLGTNPARIILGKWKLIEVYESRVGYKKIDDNDFSELIYLEFGTDSISKYQYFFEGSLRTETNKYWVDSLLHYDERISPWIYEFSNDNTLMLRNAFPALVPIERIFQRIK